MYVFILWVSVLFIIDRFSLELVKCLFQSYNFTFKISESALLSQIRWICAICVKMKYKTKSLAFVHSHDAFKLFKMLKRTILNLNPHSLQFSFSRCFELYGEF